MAQRLGCEDDRVVIELAQIFGRSFLRRLRTTIRESHAACVRARGVGGEVTAAVSRADLEAGKAVERPFEDQVRERNRRVERIADDVAEAPVASEPLLESRGSPLRMDENQAAELLRLRPERMELGVGELLACDVCADRAAAEAKLPYALFELLGGQIRVLQGHGGKGDEALRPGCAQLSELLVLHPDERSREIALGLVPVGVDAERLDVDALLVHRADAVLPHDQG